MSVVLDDYGNQWIRCWQCGIEDPAGSHLERGWRWLALSWLPTGEAPVCRRCWEELVGPPL